MAEPVLLPIKFLRECFRYEPETGRLFWRNRPASHFQLPEHADSWNKQNAGKRAFKIDPASGYGRSEVLHEGRRYRMTAGRVAFALAHGYWPTVVDHADGSPKNNRLSNLREASHVQNSWNIHKTKRPDKLRGAFLDRGQWSARANHGGKKLYLGRFDTEQEAHAAYCAFVTEHRGEFANTGKSRI